jgi:hypothetical protein
MRRLTAGTLVVLALALAATSATAAEPVRAPRSGSMYHGLRYHVDLFISGRSIELLAFNFPCGDTSGRISLNAIKLRRSDRGYRFYAVTHGNATYRDGKPDQNAGVHIRGLFTRDARVVRGRFRVTTPRCGSSGRLRWRATRVRAVA